MIIAKFSYLNWITSPKISSENEPKVNVWLLGIEPDWMLSGFNWLNIKLEYVVK